MSGFRCCGNWFYWCLLALVMLGGCATVGPDYSPPKTEMPGEWVQPADPALKPNRLEVQAWWEIFHDPFLERLIADASRGNLDLRAAVSRVREARAQLAVASGARYPEALAQGQALRSRESKNLGNPLASTENIYSAGLDASWEIDVFGRISRSIEAAAADYQASEEDRLDVLISLYAEVARTYLAVRTFQARLEAVQGNIASQREILRLTQSRFKHGLSTYLDVSQAESVLASSEAEVPPLEVQLTRAINAIGILLGERPGTLGRELRTVKPIPLPPPEVAVGVPADLLRRRPDIRRAERQLAAQTARVGVATADLYPTFSLAGTLGLASISTGSFFSSDSGFFSLGPLFNWNVFDGNRIRNRIKVQDARTEQALLFYESTVLDALGEVENAMTAYLQERMRLAALERSAEASRESLRLATRLYKDGLADFQRVLDAQRAVFDLDNQVAASKGEMAGNLVQLYRALGGGWDPDATGPSATPVEAEQK